MKSTKPSTDKTLKEAINETKIISKLIELGTTCLICFENNPFLLEWHHIGGKNNCSVTIPLCANCHLLASKNQLTYDRNWYESRKPELIKQLYILKDLQFLVNKTIEVITNEVADRNCR
ncbi:MAG: hypothetical protein WEC35_07640 [Nitrosopumilaceae archaeon]